MSKKKRPDSGESHTNKVYLVLQYLDADQRRRLIRFLRSPYFIQSRTMSPLCVLLFQHIERGDKGFDRQEVWRQLFPDEPYHDTNFRKYCSDLLRLVEQFMGQEAMRQDETRQALHTFEFVVNQKIEPLYGGALQEARAMLHKQPYRSLDHIRATYSIERHYYSMMDFDVKVNVRANIEEISYQLDLFYWIEKLKLYSAALSQQRTGNHLYQIKFIEEIVTFLREYPVEDVPELAIYYYSFLTLYEEENIEHYFNLKRLLDKYGTVMPKKEAIELYDSVLHYCTGKLNKGNRIFLQEYLDLFDSAVNKGILLLDGEMASWRFNNVVGVALRLGKFDWVENFIETYKNHLPADTRENTYAFNLARVYRYQHKYDKVLPLLHNLEYEDIGYNLIGKMMLAITYYELDEYEALNSFMHSFKTFLKRQKDIPQPLRHSFLNLLKYIRRLLSVKRTDKESIEKLKTEIMMEKSAIANHEWLLEKLDKMYQEAKQPKNTGRMG